MNAVQQLPHEPLMAVARNIDEPSCNFDFGKKMRPPESGISG
jgi:hypothetical protein